MLRGRTFKEMKKLLWILLLKELLCCPRRCGMSMYFHQTKWALESISTTSLAGDSGQTSWPVSPLASLSVALEPWNLLQGPLCEISEIPGGETSGPEIYRLLPLLLSPTRLQWLVTLKVQSSISQAPLSPSFNLETDPVHIQQQNLFVSPTSILTNVSNSYGGQVKEPFGIQRSKPDHMVPRHKRCQRYQVAAQVRGFCPKFLVASHFKAMVIPTFKSQNC